MSGYWNTLTSSCLGISSSASISQKTWFEWGCILGLAMYLNQTWKFCPFLAVGEGAVQQRHSSETELHGAKSVQNPYSSVYSLWCSVQEKVWRTGHCWCDSSLCYTLLVLEISTVEDFIWGFESNGHQGVCRPWVLLSPLDPTHSSDHHSLLQQWVPQLNRCFLSCRPGDHRILLWSWIQHFLKLLACPNFSQMS